MKYVLNTLKISHIMGRHFLSSEILDQKPALTDKALYPDYDNAWHVFYSVVEVETSPILFTPAPIVSPVEDTTSVEETEPVAEVEEQIEEHIPEVEEPLAPKRGRPKKVAE